MVVSTCYKVGKILVLVALASLPPEIQWWSFLSSLAVNLDPSIFLQRGAYSFRTRCVRGQCTLTPYHEMAS
ncbi:hypothetical protein Sjap_024890 [Stephania japonica]|uniref:Secreted protein n=1 Tax=Stephania japonica TaxID=461633 RepID=A0AAP0EJK9_9MAGN